MHLLNTQPKYEQFAEKMFVEQIMMHVTLMDISQCAFQRKF